VKGLPIKLKLLLLAGVPVLGALILSYFVAVDAQRRLESAEALGSIEDLAHLALNIKNTVDSLQEERTQTALALGVSRGAHAGLGQLQKISDARIGTLQAFLESRDTSRFPRRLSAGLFRAQSRLPKLVEGRARLADPEVKFDEVFSVIDAINADLLNAIAALTSLSDDGEMIRNISGLVSVMELKERTSREGGLLAYVFAKSQFPPGGYKTLVNVVAEQQVLEKVLRQGTSEDLMGLFDSKMKSSAIGKSVRLRQVAFETTDDAFGIDAAEWMLAQQEKMRIFSEISLRLNQRVKEAALSKIAAAELAVQRSYGISCAILVVSGLLALFISLGINRSVRSLSDAAHAVQSNGDFHVRARKVSRDELGHLTDAFNEMLGGIQTRDDELDHHRQNLEALVAARTAELAERNEAMRLVLDNVEQGLATIDVYGRLAVERSTAFNSWFGEADSGRNFAQVLASHDADARAMLVLGWEGLTDGFLPPEVAVDQIPKRLLRDGRHYALSFKPMGSEDDFHGALLMVTDVTVEVERQKRESEQVEMIRVFEAVMKDKFGFGEFFEETGRLVKEVVGRRVTDQAVLLRALHTIKGNAAISGVASVAEVYHSIESGCIEERRRPTEAERKALSAAWSSFTERVTQFAEPTGRGALQIQASDLDELVSAVQSRASHAELLKRLMALGDEPTTLRFQRIGEQAKRLAEKLGKADLRVAIESNAVRLPAERWGEFWGSFVHVVRNALDHGIEPAEERARHGKPRAGVLTLRSKIEGANCIIEMADDGRGVDWESVAQKARALGLPYETPDDLVEALFSDGVSTRDEVSDVSGRGVGMSAVRQSCRKLKGEAQVISLPGQGTTMRFRVPLLATG